MVIVQELINSKHYIFKHYSPQHATCQVLHLTSMLHWSSDNFKVHTCMNSYHHNIVDYNVPVVDGKERLHN